MPRTWEVKDFMYMYVYIEIYKYITTKTYIYMYIHISLLFVCSLINLRMCIRVYSHIYIYQCICLSMYTAKLAKYSGF